MGTADLDDVGKRPCLVIQCNPQSVVRRQQTGGKRARRGNVHRRGEDVIRGLSKIHVVIGVYQPIHTTWTAQQFGRPVGQHLIDVHIGLRPRAGLPDRQRELVRMQPADHFASRGNDRLGLVHSEQAQCRVCASASRLDLDQGKDQLGRHAFRGNVEVRQRALRLRTPQACGRHLDSTQRIALGAGCVHTVSENHAGRRSTRR